MPDDSQGGPLPPDIRFTVFTKPDGPMTKRIALAPDGSIIKDGGACRMSRGEAETVELPFDADDCKPALEALGACLERLGQNQAIALGAFIRAARDRGGRLNVARKVEARPPETWARAKDFLEFAPGRPALAMFDRDVGWDTPAVMKKLQDDFAGDWFAGVESVAPELRGAAILRRRSTSSGIRDARTGKLVSDSAGEHAYFVVRDGADWPRALAAINTRLCLAGLGSIVLSRAGAFLVRATVDSCVASPERLVFEAEPELGPGLRRDVSAITIRPGCAVDTRVAVPPLSRDEADRFETWAARCKRALRPEAEQRIREHGAAERQRLAARGVPAERAARTVAARHRGVLLGSDILRLDDGGDVPVGALLADRARYDEATCFDPHEPEAGPNRAIIYTHPDEPSRPPVLFSQLHGGGLLRLMHDAVSAAKILEGAGAAAPDRLLEALQSAEIEPHELPALIAAAVREAAPGATAKERDRAASALRKSIEAQRKARAARPRDAFDDGALDVLPDGEPRRDQVPAGFVRGATGWRFQPGDDLEAGVALCGPFRAVASVATDAGGGSGLLLEWIDAAGREHRWVLPRRLIVEDFNAALGELADRGLTLNPSARAKILLAQLLMGLVPAERRIAVRGTGWAADRPAFVMPDGSALGPDAGEVVLIDAGGAVLERTGALEGWQAGPASLARGNSRAALAVCVALSSPLLMPLGDAGAIVNLVGQSSTGKTNCLRVFSGVWGAPQLGGAGISRTWRATSNGLEGSFARFNGIGAGLDELKQSTPHEVGAVAYLLAAGAGKARAGRTGEARAVRTWGLDVFSSGEVGLATVLAKGGERVAAGMTVRFLDLPVGGAFGAFDDLHGEPDGAGFVQRLETATLADYGHAGPAFVAWLAQRRAETGSWNFVHDAALDAAAMLEMLLPADAAGQARRVMRHFVRFAAAGELATTAGVLPWDRGEAVDACGRAFRDWLAARGGAGDHEAADAIERTRDFLAEHAARFAELAPPIADAAGAIPPASARPGPRHAGFRDGRAGDFLVLPSVWAREIHAGSDHRAAARALRAAGFLEADRGDRLTTRRLIHGFGRGAYFRVKASILEAGE